MMVVVLTVVRIVDWMSQKKLTSVFVVLKWSFDTISRLTTKMYTYLILELISLISWSTIVISHNSENLWFDISWWKIVISLNLKTILKPFLIIAAWERNWQFGRWRWNQSSSECNCTRSISNSSADASERVNMVPLRFPTYYHSYLNLFWPNLPIFIRAGFGRCPRKKIMVHAIGNKRASHGFGVRKCWYKSCYEEIMLKLSLPNKLSSLKATLVWN